MRVGKGKLDMNITNFTNRIDLLARTGYFTSFLRAAVVVFGLIWAFVYYYMTVGTFYLGGPVVIMIFLILLNSFPVPDLRGLRGG